MFNHFLYFKNILNIGSGKTALLLAILNEMEMSSPSKFDANNRLTSKIIVNGSVAYVAQNHWL